MCLVSLETFNVQGLALLAQVSPPVVNNNANTSGLLLADTSILQLGEGETTAFTDFPVVSDSLGTDSGAEEGKGTDAKGSSLGLAGCATTKLAAGLVKPGADTGLPILAEMVLVEDYIFRYLDVRNPANCLNMSKWTRTVIMSETHFLV